MTNKPKITLYADEDVKNILSDVTNKSKYINRAVRTYRILQNAKLLSNLKGYTDLQIIAHAIATLNNPNKK